MSDDPLNPAHYAGRACADLGERLSANGYQILKYVWRLGRKDREDVEIGKAIWYASSERDLLDRFEAIYPGMHTAALTQDLPDAHAFLNERIADQPVFTQTIAKLLWVGYNKHKLGTIIALLEQEAAAFRSIANAAP